MPKGMYARQSPEDRFWKYVLVVESCWEWIGDIDHKGYGRLSVGGRGVRAHRYAYELRRGLIPAGLTLDHLCRNRRCVNPAHLEPTTIGDNVRRGVGITAVNALKTHCVRGHRLDSENVRVIHGNKRSCRQCERIRLQKFLRRQG